MGVWAWSVGVALVPEGSQKKLEPMVYYLINYAHPAKATSGVGHVRH